MRTNIYSQELTKEVTLVEKRADTGIVHFGVRFFLASPDILHHTSEDDDRSAITFWAPEAKSFTPEDLYDLFTQAAQHCDTISRRIAERGQPSLADEGFDPVTRQDASEIEACC